MSDTRPRLLIVDDHADFRQDLAALLGDRYTVVTAGSADKALRLFAGRRPDAVLLDIDLGAGVNGLDLLQDLRRTDTPPPIIMLTGDGRVQTAVQAMRLGATHHLTKPPDLDELHEVLARALAEQTLRRRVRSLESDVDALRGETITRDPALQRVLEQVERVAPTEATVLVTGESGTGKELIARSLHAQSRRHGGPFVALNCAAVAPGLIESELFGHEKGAFTGADRLKRGAFERTQSGTLFLDELGDSPPPLQAKLLRVLEARTFVRVGGASELPLDVRIVAATNRDLEEQVAAGKMRSDLFYRLNVFRLHLPPLRERLGDVLLLAHHFCAHFAAEVGRHIEGITPAASAEIQARDWPGNIRELRNAIERAVILSDGPDLDLPDLHDPHAPIPIPSLPYEEAKQQVLGRFRQAYVRTRLGEAGGNVSRAAELAGMKRQSFQRLRREVDPDN
ncbi:MAG: sigma-54 dependent transcriptional regulator [bacterium]